MGSCALQRPRPSLLPRILLLGDVIFPLGYRGGGVFSSFHQPGPLLSDSAATASVTCSPSAHPCPSSLLGHIACFPGGNSFPRPLLCSARQALPTLRGHPSSPAPITHTGVRPTPPVGRARPSWSSLHPCLASPCLLTAPAGCLLPCLYPSRWPTPAAVALGGATSQAELYLSKLACSSPNPWHPRV